MKTILIIDDNKDILDALAITLGSHLQDSRVHTAVSKKGGEDILKQGPVDLVMADLDMPLNEGYALIEFLAKNYPEIALCVMTRSCSGDVKERLRAMGVARSIEKPFQLEALAALLRGMLYGKNALPAD